MSEELSLRLCEDEPSPKEGIVLIKAFLAITYRRHRDAVVALAQALGTDEGDADRKGADASRQQECL